MNGVDGGGASGEAGSPGDGSSPAGRRSARNALPGRATAVSAGLVSLALLGVNGLAYLFTVLAARALAPGSYGELAALLGVMFIGVVPAAGLQTAAALRLGARPADLRLAVARVHLAAMVGAGAVGVLGLLAVVPLVALLHLSGPVPVILVVAILMPHTLIGCYDGILQGTGRYGRLAAVNGVFGVAKSGGGVAGLVVGGTPTSALTGMAIGCVASAALGWVVTGRPGIARGMRPIIHAAVLASGTLLGLVLLVNLDLLLARHHLPADLAGEYAVGAIFAKVAFWLPQGVSVVLLPRLVDPRARARALPVAVALVGGLGAVLTIATAVLGSRALPIVGGAAYGEALGSGAWVFTLLGALLAVAQLLLYGGIAAADRPTSAAVWCAAVLEVVTVEVLAATGRLDVVAIVATAVTASALLVVVGSLRTWQTGHRSTTVGRAPSPRPAQPVGRHRPSAGGHRPTRVPGPADH